MELPAFVRVDGDRRFRDPLTWVLRAGEQGATVLATTELTGTVGSWRFDDAEASQNISKSYESLGTVACYEPGLLNFSIR